MKKVLSLLLAFVFCQAQSYALSGGPRFGGGRGNFDNSSGFGGGTGSLSVIGTYGGVLFPTTVEAQGANAIGGAPAATTRSASIGLFSFAQPASGPATGAAVVFVEGTAFNGTITGIVDPGTGTFNGIIDAISSYTITVLAPTGLVDANGNPTFTTLDTNVFAQGNIDAIVTSANGGFAIDPTSGVNNGGTRIAGTASIDIFYSLETDGTPNVTTTATYTVDGFKQSDTAAAATFTVGTNVNTNGG